MNLIFGGRKVASLGCGLTHIESRAQKTGTPQGQTLSARILCGAPDMPLADVVTSQATLDGFPQLGGVTTMSSYAMLPAIASTKTTQAHL